MDREDNTHYFNLEYLNYSEPQVKDVNNNIEAPEQLNTAVDNFHKTTKHARNRRRSL